jgi:hypothetical protein
MTEVSVPAVLKQRGPFPVSVAEEGNEPTVIVIVFVVTVPHPPLVTLRL